MRLLAISPSSHWACLSDDCPFLCPWGLIVYQGCDPSPPPHQCTGGEKVWEVEYWVDTRLTLLQFKWGLKSAGVFLMPDPGIHVCYHIGPNFPSSGGRYWFAAQEENETDKENRDGRQRKNINSQGFPIDLLPLVHLCLSTGMGSIEEPISE